AREKRLGETVARPSGAPAPVPDGLRAPAALRDLSARSGAGHESRERTPRISLPIRFSGLQPREIASSTFALMLGWSYSSNFDGECVGDAPNIPNSRLRVSLLFHHLGVPGRSRPLGDRRRASMDAGSWCAARGGLPSSVLRSIDSLAPSRRRPMTTHS